MKSVQACIKAAGKAISTDDAQALLDLKRENGGNDLAAVDTYLQQLNGERASLVTQIEDLGGVVDENVSALSNRLTMDEIDFDPQLSPELSAQERKFAEEMTSRDWGDIVAEYVALDGTQGPEDTKGGKVNSVDSWRELSVDYRNDRTTSAAAHEVASAMSKKYFAQLLAEKVTPWEQYYLWTSGGTGAGKTSGLDLSTHAGDARMVFDGNLAKFGSAVRKIDQALEAGRLVVINHVMRDPIEALSNGAVIRAMRQEAKHGSGRVVPLRAHVGTHVGAADVLKQLEEHYRGDPRVIFEVTDNRNGKGRAAVSTIDDVPVYDAEEVEARGREALRDMYDNGHPLTGEKLSDEIYYGFLEQEIPAANEDTAAEVQGDGQQEPKGVRPEPEPEGQRDVSRLKVPHLRLALSPAIRSLVGKVNVEVVQSTADVPGRSIPGDVEGLWKRGTDQVYLVADNLPTIDRAKRVMAHETLGHLAMENQPEFTEILKAVRNLKNMGNAAITDAAQHVARTQGNLDAVTEAKEIVAVMAERGVQSGTMNRAFASLRQLLRRLGLNLDYSEGEVRDLMVRAARSLHKEAAAKRAAIANMPLQQQILEDPNTVQAAVRTAIDEIYPNGAYQDMTAEMHARLMGIERSGDPEFTEEERAIRQALYRMAVSPKAAPDVTDDDALYSRAFHGTDASFERFDLKYIGTGEGAQAFGWGLYFSDSRNVAQWYQGEGNLFEVEIPDDAELLSYEDMVDQQPEPVLQKIREGFPELFEEHWLGMRGEPLTKDRFKAMGMEVDMDPDRLTAAGFERGIPAEEMRGVDLYSYVGDEMLNAKQTITERLLPGFAGAIGQGVRDKMASMRLRELGIPGHTFIGNSSDKQNYVIYDDTQIQTKKINDRIKGDFEYSADHSLFSRRSESVEERSNFINQQMDDLLAGREIDELTDAERTQYHDLWLQLPRFGEERLAAQDRLAERAAARRREALEAEIERRDRIRNTGQLDLFSRAVNADPEIERLIHEKMATPLEDIKVKDRFRSLVDRFRGFDWLSAKQSMIDSAASVEALEKNLFGDVLDASESAYKAMLATKNLGSVMAAVMHAGIPQLRNGVFMPVNNRKGFVEIFEPITSHADGNLLAQWEIYAAAKRASRLINLKNEDGSSREKLFTQAEIDKALTLETQYPEFKTAFTEWQAFNSQLLDLAIKQGVINGEEAKLWRQNDYVPFYRAMEEIEYEGGQGPRAGKGIANVRPGIRRLTGSDKPLGNVFENMVMNTSYLIDAVFRNHAMQRVAAMADGIAMEKIPMAWEAVRIQDGDMARALMKAGLIVGNGTTEADMFNDGLMQVRAMTREQKEHWSKVFRRVAPKGEDVVSVLVQGKPVYYRVDDPLLLRSIAAMGAQQYGGVMNLFRMAKRTLTGAVTIDPAFMMANFVRDTLSTWVVADNGVAPPFLKALKGAASAWKQDDDTLQLMMAGAGGGGFYEHNPTEVRAMLAKKMPRGEINGFMNTVLTPRKLWRFWQRVGNASEQANRVAKYRQVIADGGTVAEAAYQARDVLNFTMSGDGEAMKFIVQTVPFLNARVQGLYRLWRGGKEHPGSFAMKGMMIMAATMALMLRNRDREEYEELPEWDKDTYWHFWVDDEHFRLPKPFEVGALFATIPERAFRLGTGRDDVDMFTDRMWRMTMDTFAFNPIPQLAKPAIEQYANRNMFTGNPIIGLAHQGVAPEAQYDPWTSETMRALAIAMPNDAPEWLRSPKRLEAAVRGYFGAVGMYALGASDAVTRRAMGHPDRPKRAIQDYPVISRFWRNPEPRTTKYASELYDMLNEADQLYKTMNAYRDQGRLAEAQELYTDNAGKLQTRSYLRDVATQMTKINKQVRAVQYSQTMTPEQKKAAIDRLNAQKRSILGGVAAVTDIY